MTLLLCILATAAVATGFYFIMKWTVPRDYREDSRWVRGNRDKEGIEDWGNLNDDENSYS